MVTPDIVGISSTIISLTSVFSIIADVGVSVGATRFLAKSFSQMQIGDLTVLLKASFLIVFSGILISSVIMLLSSNWIYPNIDFDLVVLSTPIIGMFVIAALLRSILVASLRTKSLPFVMLVSSVCRVISTVILVLLGTGVMGIIVGYLLFYSSSLVILSFILVTKLKPIKGKSTISLFHACKSIFIAGVPTWVSGLIGIAGINLGTIIVFTSAGASQAGTYFIASSIFYAVASVRSSIFDIAFPIVSAMDDQRKRLIWKLVKMSLVLILPMASTVFTYSDEIMRLIGSDYAQGSIALKILMLSIVPGTFAMGVGTLVYSYGNYWKVLGIGLATNVSRILFYFILVPLYGNTGAAVSFTVGSIVGFVISLIVANKIGMNVYWKELGLLVIIPTGLALILEYFQVNYFMGIPAILVISIILFFRSHVISKSDIKEYLEILPNRIGAPLISILNRL